MTDSRWNIRAIAKFGVYIWPLRVPIVSVAIVAGFPWLAFLPTVRPLLSGIFNPVDEKALLLITTASLFNCWTIVITSRLILAHGSTRLGLPKTSWRFFPIPIWAWVASSLLAVPVVWRAIQYSHQASGHGILEMVGYAAVGASLAAIMLLGTLTAGKWLDRANSRLGRPNAASPFGRAYVQLLRVLNEWPAISAGFLTTDQDESHEPQLASGHGLAFFLALSSLLVYILTGWLTSDIERPILASTLTYILVLVLVLTWILSFTSFALDRTRVPLAVYFLIWIAVIDTTIDPLFPTDHVYRTVATAPPIPAPTPGDVLGNSVPPIVVAASGGGIQAAAWTAQVLTGLGDVNGFNSSLRFVSAVSGGSVGVMNVLASLAECGPPAATVPADVPAFDPNTASRESSLHALGWGLVFKDLPRALLPFFSDPAVDRGSVLGDAWKREPRLGAPYPDPSPWLTSWRRNVQAGTCPGVVYNAMAAETGEPMLFPTVGLPLALERFSFYNRYPGRDVPMVTAARLSAGFPYVSTAPRADADDVRQRYLHVVDGGYFDIYGVATLTTWLHAALLRPDPVARRVLVLEICDAEVCSGHEGAEEASTGGDRQSWPYQIVAPFSGLLATWATSQRVNNRTSLRLLKDYWKTQNVCVESLEIPYSPNQPPPSLVKGAGQETRHGPLSWHLTGTEKTAIDSEWRRIRDEKTAAVAKFLTGHAPTLEGADCLAEISNKMK